MLRLAFEWFIYIEDFFLQIEPQLCSGKHVMVVAHANSLRSIIMYLDKLTSRQVHSFSCTTYAMLHPFTNKGSTDFLLTGYQFRALNWCTYALHPQRRKLLQERKPSWIFWGWCLCLYRGINCSNWNWKFLIYLWSLFLYLSISVLLKLVRFLFFSSSFSATLFYGKADNLGMLLNTNVLNFHVSDYKLENCRQ